MAVTHAKLVNDLSGVSSHCAVETAVSIHDNEAKLGIIDKQLLKCLTRSRRTSEKKNEFQIKPIYSAVQGKRIQEEQRHRRKLVESRACCSASSPQCGTCCRTCTEKC